MPLAGVRVRGVVARRARRAGVGERRRRRAARAAGVTNTQRAERLAIVAGDHGLEHERRARLDRRASRTWATLTQVPDDSLKFSPSRPPNTMPRRGVGVVDQPARVAGRQEAVGVELDRRDRAAGLPVAGRDVGAAHAELEAILRPARA